MHFERFASRKINYHCINEHEPWTVGQDSTRIDEGASTANSENMSASTNSFTEVEVETTEVYKPTVPFVVENSPITLDENRGLESFLNSTLEPFKTELLKMMSNSLNKKKQAQLECQQIMSRLTDANEKLNEKEKVINSKDDEIRKMNSDLQTALKTIETLENDIEELEIREKRYKDRLAAVAQSVMTSDTPIRRSRSRRRVNDL